MIRAAALRAVARSAPCAGYLLLLGGLCLALGCAAAPHPAVASPAVDGVAAAPGAPGAAYPANGPPIYTPPPNGAPPYAPPVNYPAGPPPANVAAYAPAPNYGPAPPGSASGVVPAGYAAPVVDGVPSAGAPPPVDTATPIVAAPSASDVKTKSDDDTGFEWSKLAPDELWKGIKNATGFGPDEKIARENFRQAEELFRQKQYEEAAKKYNTASWRWPDSTMEEDSMFLMGECYFFQNRYADASDAYTNLLKKYENSRYLDTVVKREFRVAEYWEQLDAASPHWPTTPNFKDPEKPHFDTFGNALAAYEIVHSHDPSGPYADLAVWRIANAHFRRGHWQDAADHYDIIRKDYPKSKYQRDAHLLGLQAKLQIYQGPLYDAGPLNEAKEVADQTLTQFRGRLGPEEARVQETRAQIIEQKAERELRVAAYYANKKCYGAAKTYYKTVLEQYPATQAARYAREQMEKIRNEPDSPPDHFKWLERMFERDNVR